MNPLKQLARQAAAASRKKGTLRLVESRKARRPSPSPVPTPCCSAVDKHAPRGPPRRTEFSPALFMGENNPLRGLDAMVNLAAPFLLGGGGVGGGLLAPFRGLEGSLDMARALERTVGTSRIPIDIAEFADKYEVTADLPGVDKSALRVDVDETIFPHAMTVTASRTIEPEGSGLSAEGADKEGTPADASHVVDAPPKEEEEEGGEQGAEQHATPAPAGKKGGHGKGKLAKGGPVRAWHRTERVSGTVCRTFPLPEDAEVGGVSARLHSGVLTITVPRMKLAEGQDVAGRRRVSIE